LERDEKREEAHWARFRIQWANFINANFKKKVKPQDLIKLSFDKEKEEKKVKPMTTKEMKQMFGAKFKKLNGN
jgi:hypothetical protein